ncbi:hypothetical protein TWF506_005299 [Arthrobotrys conoides]|uniref:BTB domain-containing protein n=1 Tax=Arthrobotrys conoides TaxID=74498 RepID=A0AAN8PPI8_9PEZI
MSNGSLQGQSSGPKTTLNVCKTYKHDCLADTPKMDEPAPAVGKSCLESFVRPRGTSPGNTLNSERFSQSDIVTIHLVNESLTYNVHESLLLAESSYFHRMLRIGMTESQKREVFLGLQVDTKIAFERFVQWCYFGHYVYDNDKNLPLLSIDAAVYVFAKRVMCDGLQDFALNQAKALCDSRNTATIRRNLPTLPDTIEFIYENTFSSDDQQLDSLFDLLEVNQLDPGPLLRDRPQGIGAVGSSAPQDDFRKLLASVSARHLVQLRKEPSFMKVHRSLSDFAADVLFFVQQSSDEPVKKSPCILS